MCPWGKCPGATCLGGLCLVTHSVPKRIALHEPEGVCVWGGGGSNLVSSMSRCVCRKVKKMCLFFRKEMNDKLLFKMGLNLLLY